MIRLTIIMITIIPASYLQAVANEQRFTGYAFSKNRSDATAKAINDALFKASSFMGLSLDGSSLVKDELTSESNLSKYKKSYNKIINIKTKSGLIYFDVSNVYCNLESNGHNCEATIALSSAITADHLSKEFQIKYRYFGVREVNCPSNFYHPVCDIGLLSPMGFYDININIDTELASQNNCLIENLGGSSFLESLCPKGECECVGKLKISATLQAIGRDGSISYVPLSSGICEFGTGNFQISYGVPIGAGFQCDQILNSLYERYAEYTR